MMSFQDHEFAKVESEERQKEMDVQSSEPAEAVEFSLSNDDEPKITIAVDLGGGEV